MLTNDVVSFEQPGPGVQPLTLIIIATFLISNATILSKIILFSKMKICIPSICLQYLNKIHMIMKEFITQLTTMC